MSINLRPRDYAQNRGINWLRLAFISGVMVYIFAVFFAGLSLQNLKVEEEINLEKLKEEYRLVLEEGKNMEEKIDQLDRLEQDKKELEEIFFSGVKWHPCLDLIINAFTNEAQIESITGSGSDISLRGRSENLGAIAVHLNTLEEAGLFRKVYFQEITGHHGGYFYFSFQGKVKTLAEVMDDAV